METGRLVQWSKIATNVKRPGRAKKRSRLKTCWQLIARVFIIPYLSEVIWQSEMLQTEAVSYGYILSVIAESC